MHPVAFAALEPGGELRCQLRRVELAGPHPLGPHVVVGDERHHHAGVRRSAVPVRLVRREHEPVTRGPGREPVRAGANRLAVERRLVDVLPGERLRRDDPQRQPLQERRVRVLQGEHHSRRVGRGDGGEHVQIGAQRRVDSRIEHRLVGEHHVLGGQWAAVVEQHALAQLRGDRLPVRRDGGQFTGQGGHEFVAGVPGDQPVEDQRRAVDAVVEHRVERVRLARGGDHQRAGAARPAGRGRRRRAAGDGEQGGGERHGHAYGLGPDRHRQLLEHSSAGGSGRALRRGSIIACRSARYRHYSVVANYMQ